MAAIRWGVVSTAKIGREFVIPAILKASGAELAAIASRDLPRAEACAAEFGAARAHGSYEALFADPGIDAIYNPLPNHLHVTVTRQAAAAGKHVLCEKPLGMTADEAAELIAVRDRTGLVIQEAFMVRSHPQWKLATGWIAEGRIGRVVSVATLFSYYNRDPANVRNKADIGGGALFDIGCYAILSSRLAFGREPLRVAATLDRDPAFGVDRLTSALLDYGEGATATFTISTQMVPYQRVQILGEKGRIEIVIPFNAPIGGATRVFLDDGASRGDASAQATDIEPVDQYALEIEDFGRAVRGEAPPAMTLEESVANMRVIDAVFRAAETGAWVPLR
jgi:predicted dehydrogenase